jgi:hypothetical protein
MKTSSKIIIGLLVAAAAGGGLWFLTQKKNRLSAADLVVAIKNSILNNSPYDATLDLNHDGFVDILDLTLASKLMTSG